MVVSKILSCITYVAGCKSKHIASCTSKETAMEKEQAEFHDIRGCGQRHEVLHANESL
jgi:hypothetical protein